MDNIAIIGAGTMGHSLALVFAQGGYKVALNDVSEEVLERAKSHITTDLEALAEVGLLNPAERSKILNERLTLTTDLASAVAKADFVIEAVVEVAEVKKKLFTDLDLLSPPEAILASNTSYLDIFKFVETKRPGKVIITHWFAPPHIVPLVEIVPGPETSPETVSMVKEVIDGLGKETIVLKEFLPGFIGNRLQSALSLEAFYLIDNGFATAEDIDKATKAGFGLRIPLLGLMQRQDFTGLDLMQRILKNKQYHPPEVRGRSDALDELVSKGKLGVKTGRGFYDYGGRSTEDISKERDLKLLKLKKFLRELGDLG